MNKLLKTKKNSSEREEPKRPLQNFNNQRTRKNEAKKKQNGSQKTKTKKPKQPHRQKKPKKLQLEQTKEQ